MGLKELKKNQEIHCRVNKNVLLLKDFPIIQITVKSQAVDRTEVRFVSFFSGGFITAIVVNQPERKLGKRTSVDRSTIQF